MRRATIDDGRRARAQHRGLALAVGIVLLLGTGCGGDDESREPTLVFQAPADTGVGHVLPSTDEEGKAVLHVFHVGKLVGRVVDGVEEEPLPGVYDPLPRELEDHERLVTSVRGPGAGIVTFFDRPGVGDEMRFELIRNGQGAWTADLKRRASIYIAEDSSVVVAVAQDVHAPDPTAVTFFDAQGTPSAPVVVPRVHTVAMSTDGGRVVLGSWDDTVRVFSGSGQLLRRPIPGVGDLRLSDDGTTLVVLERNGALLLTERGRQLLVRTQTWARDAAIAPSGSIAVIDSAILHYHDATQRATSVLLTVDSTVEMLQSVAFDIAFDRVLVGSIQIDAARLEAAPTRTQEGNATAVVRELSLTGEILRKQSFPTTVWSAGSPVLRPLANRRAMVVMPDQVRVFEGEP